MKALCTIVWMFLLIPRLLGCGPASVVPPTSEVAIPTPEWDATAPCDGCRDFSSGAAVSAIVEVGCEAGTGEVFVLLYHRLDGDVSVYLYTEGQALREVDYFPAETLDGGEDLTIEMSIGKETGEVLLGTFLRIDGELFWRFAPTISSGVDL